MHFSRELPDAFYQQLLSEKRQRVRTSRGTETRWVKPNSGVRNEALDCCVYALFAAHVLGAHTATEAAWRRREQQLLGQPVVSTPSTVAVQDVAAPRVAIPPPALPARRCRGSIATGRAGW
jgi:phage terminase large subunit GpA-like protein